MTSRWPEPKKSLADLYPEICEEWSDENPLTPFNFKPQSHIKVKWKCKKCGLSWETTPYHRIKGAGCHACWGRQVSDKNRFSLSYPIEASEWYHELNKGVKPEDVSFGSNYKFFFKCKKCNNIWESSVNHRSSGKGCPKCKISKGELLISNILDSLNITYYRQYIFPECRDTLPLPFDFLVDCKSKFLIEYQGELHFKPSRFRNANIKFKQTQKHDYIKRNFCFKNQIPLLILTYLNKDLKNTLIDSVKEYENVSS